MLIKKLQGPAQFVPMVNCVIGTKWVKVQDEKGKALLMADSSYVAKERVGEKPKEKKTVQIIKNPEPLLVKEDRVFEKKDVPVEMDDDQYDLDDLFTNPEIDPFVE